jgi:cytochrome P450
VTAAERIVGIARFLRRHRRSPRGLPPGPREPAAWQLYRWIGDPVPFLRESRARYGRAFTIRLPGSIPVVMFSDPRAIKDVFTGSPDVLHAGKANVVLEPMVGANSLLLLDGPRHLRERRLLMPPFHGDRMHRYGAVMREITLRSMERWPRGVSFPVHAQTQSITLDVILRTVFGLEEGAQMTALRGRLVELMDGVSNPWMLLPFVQLDFGPRSPGGRLRRLREEVDAALYAEIDRRRRSGAEGREDVFSMLVEAKYEDGTSMGRESLRDELLTLLAAGHETTATALAWTFHLLVENRRVLDRLVAELDALPPEKAADAPYLDAVVKESLRLQPVVPGVGRALEAPMRIGDWDIPAGTMVAPSIYLTHHDPDVWPDPERFDPERFVHRKPTPYEWLPFGGGVRRCIGMAFALYEMKVVLATVLRGLAIERAPGARVKLVRRAVTFTPSGGMPLVVRDRS